MDLFMNRKKPALGVISCLLGMNVRYDGSNKQHTFISSVLNKHFDLFPVCPEVAIGMGVLRASIQLRILDGELHAVGVNNQTQDVTTALQASGQQQVTHAHSVDTYSKASLLVVGFQIPVSFPRMASVLDRAFMPGKSSAPCPGCLP